MPINNNNKLQGLGHKIVHETTMLLIYTCYLLLFFIAFTVYRKLILDEYGLGYIDYVRFGYNLVESLILAKAILLGQMFGLGEKFAYRSLIYSTLYKTVVFLIFVLFFSVIEHFVVGYFRGKGVYIVYEELLSKGFYLIFAEILVMFVAFIPFFAFLETGRVIGYEKLGNLFFRREKEGL